MNFYIFFICILTLSVFNDSFAEDNARLFLLNCFKKMEETTIPSYKAEFVRFVYRQPLNSDEISKKIDRRAELLDGLNDEEVQTYQKFFQEDYPELVYYEEVTYSSDNYIIYKTRQLKDEIKSGDSMSFVNLTPDFYYEDYVYDLKNNKFYNTDYRLKSIWVKDQNEEYSGKYFDFMLLPEQWFGGIKMVVDFDESKDKRIRYSSFNIANDGAGEFEGDLEANIVFPSKHYYKIFLDSESSNIKCIQYGFDDLIHGTDLFCTYKKFEGWNKDIVVDFFKTYNQPRAGIVAERIFLVKINFSEEIDSKTGRDILNSYQGYDVRRKGPDNIILGKVGESFDFNVVDGSVQ